VRGKSARTKSWKKRITDVSIKYPELPPPGERFDLRNGNDLLIFGSIISWSPSPTPFQLAAVSAKGESGLEQQPQATNWGGGRTLNPSGDDGSTTDQRTFRPGLGLIVPGGQTAVQHS